MTDFEDIKLRLRLGLKIGQYGIKLLWIKTADSI